MTSLLKSTELGDRADKEDERNICANLGKASLGLGQHDESIYFQTKALETSQATGNKTGEAFDPRKLGNSYVFLGKYESGIKYMEISLAINKAAGDKQGEVNSSYNLASLYTVLGRYDKAMSHLERSLDISVQSRTGRELSILLKASHAVRETPNDAQRTENRAILKRWISAM